jgi:hypothetical protein
MTEERDKLYCSRCDKWWDEVPRFHVLEGKRVLTHLPHPGTEPDPNYLAYEGTTEASYADYLKAFDD